MKNLLAFLAIAILFLSVQAKPADPAATLADPDAEAAGAAASGAAAANGAAAAIGAAAASGAAAANGAAAAGNPATGAASAAQGMAENAMGGGGAPNLRDSPPFSMMTKFSQFGQKAFKDTVDTFKNF